MVYLRGHRFSTVDAYMYKFLELNKEFRNFSLSIYQFYLPLSQVSIYWEKNEISHFPYSPSLRIVTYYFYSSSVKMLQSKWMSPSLRHCV